MHELWYQLRWALPVWFLCGITDWLPDNRITYRLRGTLLRPFIRACGKNFQLGLHVTLLNTHNLRIGNDVYLAKGTWLNCLGGITIEDEVICAPYVVISSLQHVMKDGSFRFGGSSAGPVTIGRGSWLAAHVSVKCGVTIGKANLIAANACVVKDTPDHAIIGGVPGKPIGETTDGDAAELITRARTMA